VLHLKKRDGIPFSVSVTALSEFDENSNVVFIYRIVQDISRIIVQNDLQKYALTGSVVIPEEKTRQAIRNVSGKRNCFF
jgi:hypothetical protein